MADQPRRKRVKLHDVPQVITLVDRAEAAHYWQMLAYVDVTKELNPTKLSCCRHCYGVDNQYQFTQQEMRLARREHLKRQLQVDQRHRVPFDELGGDGYNPNLKPNQDCPECFGDGVLRAVPIDFEKLSPGARLLWDGVKIGSNGIVEHKLRARDRAMENLQKIMGFETPVEVPDFETLPDLAIDKALEKAISQGLVSVDDLRKLIDVVPDNVEYSK